MLELRCTELTHLAGVRRASYQSKNLLLPFLKKQIYLSLVYFPEKLRLRILSLNTMDLTALSFTKTSLVILWESWHCFSCQDLLSLGLLLLFDVSHLIPFLFYVSGFFGQEVRGILGPWHPALEREVLATDHQRSC